METVMVKWWVLETKGQQIMTTLPQHILNKKYEIEWSCDKWSGYKRLWFHSYFIILSIVSHHYVSNLHTTKCPGLNSVRLSTEYCSSSTSASISHWSAQVETAATMVMSTVVAETTDVWAIWESYHGIKDWRSCRIPKLCTVRTCNVSGDCG